MFYVCTVVSMLLFTFVCCIPEQDGKSGTSNLQPVSTSSLLSMGLVDIIVMGVVKSLWANGIVV